MTTGVSHSGLGCCDIVLISWLISFSADILPLKDDICSNRSIIFNLNISKAENLSRL